jgi:hypothetical protein
VSPRLRKILQVIGASILAVICLLLVFGRYDATPVNANICTPLANPHPPGQCTPFAKFPDYPSCMTWVERANWVCDERAPQHVACKPNADISRSYYQCDVRPK